jgi:hypothetical protein
MGIFFELTKKYIEDRSKHVKEHWYSNLRLLKLFNPIPNKRIDAWTQLLDGDLKFSIIVKDWLHKEIKEYSLNIEELRNWITHVKAHIIKLQGRIYYVLIFSASILLFFSILSNSALLLKVSLLSLLVLASAERVMNHDIQSSLNELILYLEREIESMGEKQK